MIEKINKNAIEKLAKATMHDLYIECNDYVSNDKFHEILYDNCYSIKPFDKFDDEEYQSGKYVDIWNDTMVEVVEQVKAKIKGWEFDRYDNAKKVIKPIPNGNANKTISFNTQDVEGAIGVLTNYLDGALYDYEIGDADCEMVVEHCIKAIELLEFSALGIGAVSKEYRERFEKAKKQYFTEEEQEEYGIDAYGFSTTTNEQYVRCAWCGEIVPISETREERDLGQICEYCIDEIKSRGERLHFID